MNFKISCLGFEGTGKSPVKVSVNQELCSALLFVSENMEIFGLFLSMPLTRDLFVTEQFPEHTDSSLQFRNYMAVLDTR